MIEYTEKTIKVPNKLICDRCKKIYDTEEDIFETQEFLHINFEGGFESVFGDMSKVKADICQHCLKELIEPFAIIKKEGDNT